MTIIDGETVTFVGTFRDREGALVDPSDVTLRLMSPSGVVGSYDVARVSLGVWQVSRPVDGAGTWRWRMDGASPVGGAAEGRFVANPSAFT